MSIETESDLILAAEECPPEHFGELHVFTEYEEKIIRKLVAHGPVLLRGGRGSGKSALMIEAERRIDSTSLKDSAFGLYLSLRYLPLLKSSGNQYQQIFCDLLTKRMKEKLQNQSSDFSALSQVFDNTDISRLRQNLMDLANRLQRRVVLIFDDAAHIGRETPLSEFFDIIRTISSNSVACKAAIYPGVTRFGTRFDVYNDATVVDVNRSEEGYKEFFSQVFRQRYAKLSDKVRFSRELSLESAMNFLGRAVIGNVRAFVHACNRILAQYTENTSATFGFPQMSELLLDMSQNFYWPMLDEVKGKLGKYEILINPAQELAGDLYKAVTAKPQNVSRWVPSRSALVHREHVERLSKLFEILEYAGFIMRKDASRAMKSGGRGTRFSMNLCNLFENVTPARLTKELFDTWSGSDGDPIELYRGGKLDNITLPSLGEEVEPSILQMSISSLKKSAAYPYGLTAAKIKLLRQHGYRKVEDLATATDEQIDAVDGIGTQWVKRIRSVVNQSIWM